jgi:hypothetical protein
MPNFRTRLVLAAAIAIAAAAIMTVDPQVAGAATSTPNWIQLKPTSSPPQLGESSMVYDRANGTVVLFGGHHSNSSATPWSNATWVWNGTTWSRQSPSASPSPRADASMVYDAANGTVVLFGGYSPSSGGTGYTGDTWIWNGTTWVQQFPTTSPPPRAYQSMAYDPSTGNVVLFGGAYNGSPAYSDTWTWDGANWTQQTPTNSPSVRANAAMAYDPVTGDVVLFGGFNATPTLFNDTWLWNGSNWNLARPSTNPSPRDGGSMQFDPSLNKVVLFGGNTLAGVSSETWAWDGTNWMQLFPQQRPSARSEFGLAYDPSSQSMILFGGNSSSEGVLADTWELGNQSPTIGSENSTTFSVGQDGTFAVTTSAGWPTPELTEIGSLPSGVTFTDNGNGTADLAGVPASGTGGQYSIEIVASNGIQPDAMQPFTLSVLPLTIVTTSLPDGNAGTPYSTTLTASGDYAPYSWRVIAGELPKGLHLGGKTGTISGTTRQVGTVTLTIEALGVKHKKHPRNVATRQFSLTMG